MGKKPSMGLFTDVLKKKRSKLPLHGASPRNPPTASSSPPPPQVQNPDPRQVIDTILKELGGRAPGSKASSSSKNVEKSFSRPKLTIRKSARVMNQEPKNTPKKKGSDVIVNLDEDEPSDPEFEEAMNFKRRRVDTQITTPIQTETEIQNPQIATTQPDPLSENQPTENPNPTGSNSETPLPNPPNIPTVSPIPQMNPQPISPSSTQSKPKPKKKNRERDLLWKKSIEKRSVTCERQVLQGGGSKMTDFSDPITALGIEVWFEQIPKYVLPILQEFYREIQVKENKVVSKVRGKVVVVTPNRIARFLGCDRPLKEEIDYPVEGYESPRGEELARKICTADGFERFQKEKKFKQGMLLEKAALMNKLIHSNIKPGGSEKTPSERSIQLGYELLEGKTIDLAEIIFNCLCDFRTQTSMCCGLPYAHMITTMCIGKGVKLGPKDRWDKATYGAISTTTMNKMAPRRLSKEKAVEREEETEQGGEINIESGGGEQTPMTGGLDSSVPSQLNEPSNIQMEAVAEVRNSQGNQDEVKDLILKFMEQQKEDAEKLDWILMRQREEGKKTEEMYKKQQLMEEAISVLTQMPRADNTNAGASGSGIPSDFSEGINLIKLVLHRQATESQKMAEVEEIQKENARKIGQSANKITLMELKQQEYSKRIDLILEGQKRVEASQRRIEERQLEDRRKLAQIMESQRNWARMLMFLENKALKFEKAGALVQGELERSKLREQSLVRGVHSLIQWVKNGIPPTTSMFPKDPTAPEPEAPESSSGALKIITHP